MYVEAMLLQPQGVSFDPGEERRIFRQTMMDTSRRSDGPKAQGMLKELDVEPLSAILKCDQGTRFN